MNVTLVCGEPGSGKTTYVSKLIEAHRHPRRTFIVIAPWGGIRGTDVGTVADLYRRGSCPPVALVHDEPDAAAEFCLWRTGCVLVVDEIHQWAPRGMRLAATGSAKTPGAPRGERRSSALWRILHEGRHFKTALIGMTQRPFDVSYDLLCGVWTCIFFRLSDPAALSWVLTKTGSRRVRDAVSQHRGYLPLVWQPGREPDCEVSREEVCSDVPSSS